MGRATLWAKGLAVAIMVLVLAAGASVPPGGRLGERGSYALDSATSGERLRDVLNRRDTGAVTFVITAEGADAAADVSVTPPLPFSVGARYGTKWNLTKGEAGRLRAENRAENRRLHRRGTLPMAIRVPVTQLNAYDEFTVRASTVPGAGFCGDPEGEPWYLTTGTCGSPGTGPNRARCVAVYAGRIVDADLGATMSACEVGASDLKDALCGPRPCLPEPKTKGPRSPSARHGRATVVTGLRDDGSLAPRPPHGPDRVTFTITGPPGREANITLPVQKPGVPPGACLPKACPAPTHETPPQRRRLPHTFSVAAREITGTEYTVKATTVLDLPGCPKPRSASAISFCADVGPGRNLARCVATFRGRIVDTDLGGTSGICRLDANDLRPR